MANIDQLSIEINADADKASKAIGNLTAHLQGLSRALSSINTNSIRQFANSIESLSKTGRATDAATKSIENMAKALSSEFGIKSKAGIQAVTDGLLNLADASKKWQQSDFSDKFESQFKDAQGSVAAIIRDYAKIEKQLDDDTRAVVDFVNNTRKGSVSISNFAKEFGDDFAQMKKNLGKGFTSELDATKKGIQDFEEYMQSLKEATNTSMFDNLAPDAAFEKLSSIMDTAKNSTMSYSEAVRNGAFAFDYANRVIDQYGVTIDRLVMQQDRLTKENGIDALVNSLKGLSEVSVPDFSSFAHAIEVLNKVNVDRVTRNLEKVKETLAEGTQKAQEMCTALVPMEQFSFDNLGNITGFIMGASDGVKDLSLLFEAMAQKTNDMGQEFMALVPIENDVVNGAESFGLKLSECGAIIEDMLHKMQDFSGFFAGKMNSVPFLEDFRTYKPDIVDTVEVIQMGMNPEPVNEMTASVDGLFEAFRSLGEEFSTPDILKPFEDAPEKIDETKKAAKELGAELSGLASILKKVEGAFSSLANIGMKIMQGLLTPFKGLKSFADYLVRDFQSKTEEIRNMFSNMADSIQNQMSRISAFWQRTIRTFTFMLVRKAITALIKDVKEAIDELVLFEEHLGNLSGGEFNNSISEILADFHLVGRAIVAAFEPLINWVVPILNAVANAVANVLATLGEFLAAFTGQTYFVKARKTVVDYGKSLEDAEDTAEDTADNTTKAEEKENDALDDKKEKLKEIKKLLLGIDELNILPKQEDDDDTTKTKTPKTAKEKTPKVKKTKTPKGSGINYHDAYEELPVSSAMQDFVNKIKGILADLFEPMKNAWDKVFPYLKTSWEYMGSELLKLAKSIGSAFLEAWKSPITEHIFEMLFTIIGDLMVVVGNLAKGFRTAWDSITNNGKRLGVEIFENLLKIIDILITHVQNVTEYMKDWSQKIDFKPLLNGINNVLIALQPVADFLGGVFEDVMENIVLEHIRYLIEEGIPHLCHAIEEITKSFDFEKLRTQLQPVEKAFEKMTQQIHEGLINAMKNLGVELGKWTQTENFQKFLDGIEKFMGKITAERVEKLFTGLGLGILKIVEGLADFVGSDDFDKWCDEFFEWYDSLSAEDIAKFFEGIATGIFDLATKVAAFIFSDGFKKFIEKITQWYKDLSSGDIADKIKNLATAIGTFTFAAFVTGGVANFLNFLSQLVTFAKNVGLPTLLGNIATKIGSIGGAAAGAEGGATGFTAALSGISGAVAPIAIAVGLVIAAFASLSSAYGGLKGIMDKCKETFGQAGDAIKQFAEKIKLQESIDKLKQSFENLKQKLEPLKEAFGNLYNALGKLKPVWDILFAIIEKIAAIVGGALMIAFKGLVEFMATVIDKIGLLADAFTGAIDIISGVIDVIAGFISVIIGLFTGNKELVAEGAADFASGIYLAIAGFIEETKALFDFFGQPLLAILEGFFPGISQAFDDFVQGIIDFFKDMKYQLIGDPIIIDMVQGILDWFNTLMTDGLQYISDLVGGAIDFFVQLASDGVGKAIEFKDNALTAFGQFKENALGKFQEFKENAVTKATEFKEGAVEKYENFKEEAEKKIDAFKQGGEKIFDTAKTAFVGGINGFKNEAVKKYEEFKKGAMDKFEEFKKDAPKAINDAKKDVIDKAKEMKQNFSDKVNEMKTKAKEKFNDIKTLASEKFTSVKDKIKERMQSTVEDVKTKLDNMKQKFQNLSLESVASNIINGFLRGLRSAWQSVVQWANEAVSSIKSKFQEALQINSPSKVFEQYGKYTVQGYNEGLVKYADTTDKAIDKWVDDFQGMTVTLTPEIEPKLSSAKLINTPVATSEQNTGLTKEDLMDALTRFGDMFKTQQGSETRVILEMDGRQIYESVVNQNKQQILRSGKSLFAY